MNRKQRYAPEELANLRGPVTVLCWNGTVLRGESSGLSSDGLRLTVADRKVPLFDIADVNGIVPAPVVPSKQPPKERDRVLDLAFSGHSHLPSGMNPLEFLDMVHPNRGVASERRTCETCQQTYVVPVNRAGETCPGCEPAWTSRFSEGG